jgi:hypothetical protein
MKMVRNGDVSWEQIYADIDIILNSGIPEYQEKSKQEEIRRKARIVRLKWKPDETAYGHEVNIDPGEIPGQIILKASGKDRRHMFR